MKSSSSSSQKYHEFDAETGPNFQRKKSLVRHERARMDDPSNPNYHYVQVVNQEADHLHIRPSSTGLDPTRTSSMTRSNSKKSRRSKVSTSAPLNEEEEIEEEEKVYRDDYEREGDIQLDDLTSSSNRNDLEMPHQDEKDEAKASLKACGLENDEFESCYYYAERPLVAATNIEKTNNSNKMNLWQAYCWVITFWAPAPLLKLCGLTSKTRQFAWREKMALISIILYIGAFVAFITFGFTASVCGKGVPRLKNNEINTGYLIINGKAYDLTSSSHPEVAGISAGANILYPPTNAGGKDASFLFQNVNGNCKGLITPKSNCSIPYNDEELAWYMPCKLFDQDGSTKPNFAAEYYNGYACHTTAHAREAYYDLTAAANIFFTWEDIKNSSRNLIVYSGEVLDLDLIDWIQSDDLNYPELFDRLRDDKTMRGHDISLLLSSNEERKAAKCLSETIKVGSIDSVTLGCIASIIVLYVSLVFILSVVISKFFVACYFKWVVSRKQGANIVDNMAMLEHDKKIDDWSNDINAPGPIKEVPVKQRASYCVNKKTQSKINLFSRGSRSSLGDSKQFQQILANDDNPGKVSRYVTMGTQAYKATQNQHHTIVNKNPYGHHSTTSLLYENESSTEVIDNRRESTLNLFETTNQSLIGGFDNYNIQSLLSDIVLPDVVPQPPVDYEPYDFPLAHTICLVTCYSEDESGLRTTLDSVSTTDYPNSHKLIVILCDGLIKGSGNDKTTPEIALNMMTDFAIPEDKVKAYSYVSVAQGTKRHNMAKVFAGFYKYDENTVPLEKQQRVPVVTIVKCGTPAEQNAAKPGNRGKRDSQIIIMSFLQKIMFDERMTELEFEILNNIWRVTGLMTEFYEIVLMVDADTKVYPDSLTHMVAEMVKHPDVMGLCGETKISNKTASWVTAIQVFEYYISHHQAKAFESVFGCVTCLPGCFCMYRIKAPKGPTGYWVPILANPDIVERYSENIIETLHAKNLLLLGEDRYLSSLMLRTFPKRKQIFVPKAACKTIVPDKFSVLLSQRRRWINSTVHNLMELVLIKDLCGTFCFSMQFVIAIELIGTLILPAAICFTFYVIIFSIVSKPTPVLTLILLAVIFGLPGLLVIVTVSSWMYVLWMIIYMFALPVWNFILPAYAYWKFDDFSWGDTRKTASDIKGGGHDENAGEFDGSSIIQKRWKDFERDRRREKKALSVPVATWNPSQQYTYNCNEEPDMIVVDNVSV
ncbi:hypothetical protein PACTADRAFT_14587 [Pachysolen tannophilus NRRL Y-2460]|uniref:chitin synthase n=1 Tax=Pachysolen tannophilus NRRL Y-2460 TaxID=669874 RepID=A0A1E4U277_PACTA|nr:hypothetical protein PACTADRAFT_14587 [Pachysolen tannophilus NRRL Y-2460]